MSSIFTAHSVGFELRFELVKRYSCFKFIAGMSTGGMTWINCSLLCEGCPWRLWRLCGRLPQRPWLDRLPGPIRKLWVSFGLDG